MLFYVFYEYVEYLILQTKGRYRYEHSAMPPLHFPPASDHITTRPSPAVFCLLLFAMVWFSLLWCWSSKPPFLILLSHFSHMLLKLKQRSVYSAYSTFPAWFRLGLYCTRSAPTGGPDGETSWLGFFCNFWKMLSSRNTVRLILIARYCFEYWMTFFVIPEQQHSESSSSKQGYSCVGPGIAMTPKPANHLPYAFEKLSCLYISKPDQTRTCSTGWRI